MDEQCGGQGHQTWDEQRWRAAEQAHATAVEGLTAGHLERHRRGVGHPVEDFLFTYYAHRPGQLRRWHPGAGAALEGASERADWKHYRYDGRAAWVDLPTFVAERGDTVAFVRRLLAATLGRRGHFGCFGLHEWAMVYRLTDEQVRHAGWPLRLGSTGTDRVLESHTVKCSHFDAFRFFTDQARPRNTLSPRRDTQVDLEQPGCLHAGMDLYKWAFKLSPVVPSDLLLDCFVLAREVRELDMRASPYDLSELGYEPVPIETPAGKAAYVEAQRGFAARGQGLRQLLVDVCDAVMAAAGENDQLPARRGPR